MSQSDMDLTGAIGRAALGREQSRGGRLDELVARVALPRLLTHLEAWRVGRLTVHLPGGAKYAFGQAEADPSVHLRVHSPALFRKFALSGDLGAGEAYMDGDWSADDLPRLLALVLRNGDALALESPLSKLLNLPNDWRHRRRQNTRAGSRRNIRQHYDLGNAFYSLFLDETMTYSSAMFGDADRSLADAQREKYRALARRIGLRPGQHVLEIGCGWGGFAELAAREFGARVTGITVSDEQHDFARARIARAGLADRVEILLCDYRDVAGTFDHVVSIEMLEAVGREYWGTFFASCDRLLARGGRVAVQVITMPDYRFEHYARHCDWIQKYIFPGGLLPSLTELGKAAASVSTLTVTGVDDIARDYACTLSAWRQAFLRRLPEVRAQGFDNRFIRMWDYYLSACEAAFRVRMLGTMQITWARAGEDLR